MKKLKLSNLGGGSLKKKKKNTTGLNTEPLNQTSD